MKSHPSNRSRSLRKMLSQYLFSVLLLSTQSPTSWDEILQHLIVLQFRAPNTIKTRTWQSLHNKEQTKILPSLMELFPLLSRAIKSHFPSQVLSLLQITAVHITNKLCRYYLCLSGAPRRQQRWNYQDLLHSSNTDIKCFIIFSARRWGYSRGNGNLWY